VLSGWLIRIFLPGFIAAIPIVAILLPGIIAISITLVVTSDLNGRGRPLPPSLAAFASTLVGLVLYLELIPRRGMWGAAVASSISYSFSALLSLILFAAITKVRIHQLLVPRIADLRHYEELWMSLRARFAGSQQS